MFTFLQVPLVTLAFNLVNLKSIVVVSLSRPISMWNMVALEPELLIGKLPRKSCLRINDNIRPGRELNSQNEFYVVDL